MEKKEPSYTVSGNVNWQNHYGEQYGGSLKKLKIGPPYDPTIPLLGICPENTMIQKDTCTPVFLVALFTVARTSKQPNFPWSEEWIKMWYMYTMEYYSAIKKNKITPFAATWMDQEILILSEVRHKGKSITYMWNLKKKKRVQMNLFTKQK